LFPFFGKNLLLPSVGVFKEPSFVLKASSDNGAIAQTCQESNAACCRKGKLFIPESEYTHIANWILNNSPDELKEFQSRLEVFDGFYLYDQQDTCQFLDRHALCRLHTSHVKPSECFWWPLHVYKSDTGELEIKAANYCCLAAVEITKETHHVDLMEKQARHIGLHLITAFRNVYPGAPKDKVLVRKLRHATP
jgi:Fe-S-cluster containining protein